eukprot:CAMPEP_0194527310 /NCGR_PEP_ID=MMETSP0253-20130528/63366_1 /TAXON_ID=2966 /ORGANISM="Noctiluca scintillans" /LENGTH=202 /DNA_ID=CAMNT_0039372231 /DNA_START=309 /DNA_END=918 /DNA_ORIENTATION=+
MKRTAAKETVVGPSREEHSLEESAEEDHNNESTTRAQIQQPEKEVPVVVEAHAVADPQGVVVHFQHAAFADHTVERTGGLAQAASRTAPEALSEVQLPLASGRLTEIELRWLAWIHRHCFYIVVEHVQEQEGTHSTKNSPTQRRFVIRKHVSDKSIRNERDQAEQTVHESGSNSKSSKPVPNVQGVLLELPSLPGPPEGRNQ